MSEPIRVIRGQPTQHELAALASALLIRRRRYHPAAEPTHASPPSWTRSRAYEAPGAWSSGRPSRTVPRRTCEDALAAVQEATDTYRELAAARPHAFTPTSPQRIVLLSIQATAPPRRPRSRTRRPRPRQVPYRPGPQAAHRGVPAPGGSLIPSRDTAIGDPMPSNTTAQAQPTAASAGTSPPDLTVDQARAAWATASRDTELDRWRDLYALAVRRS